MTGLEIFMVGGLIVSTSFLAGVILNDKKKQEVKPVNDSADTQPAEDKPNDKPEPQKSLVGKSTLDLSEYEALIAKAVEKSVEKVLPVALSELLGDVNLKDVEFTPTNDETEKHEESASPETEQEPKPEKPKFRPMDSEATNDAFNTDMRDVDDMDYPSAPTASGNSIDEIEKAVDTALDDSATEADKAEAGKTLNELKDTEVFDHLSANDEISRRIDLCIRLSIRAEIQAKNGQSKPNPTPKSEQVVKSVQKKTETSLNLPDSFEDFDVSSIFK